MVTDSFFLFLVVSSPCLSLSFLSFVAPNLSFLLLFSSIPFHCFFIYHFLLFLCTCFYLFLHAFNFIFILLFTLSFFLFYIVFLSILLPCIMMQVFFCVCVLFQSCKYVFFLLCLLAFPSLSYSSYWIIFLISFCFQVFLFIVVLRWELIILSFFFFNVSTFFSPFFHFPILLFTLSPFYS